MSQDDPMPATPDPEPDDAAARPRPRQRKRLAGWLIAAGLSDAAAAGRLATTLLLADEDLGVAGWIQRLDRHLRTAPAGTATPLARLAASDDPAALVAEEGVEASPAAAPAPGDPRVPLLPPTLPREMKRQPLGRLPAVLRGGAWILSARHALPHRVGPRLSRTLWSWRDSSPETSPPAPGAAAGTGVAAAGHPGAPDPPAG